MLHERMSDGARKLVTETFFGIEPVKNVTFSPHFDEASKS